jgi:diguanylate cyclase (GGDEF)-like protein/PAS domain S-box-containing protein
VDKKFYKGLLDQVSDGVYFVTLDRRITYWNGGAERITGYSSDEVVGRSCADGILCHVNDAGLQLCGKGCPLQAVMMDGKPREAHVYLHHKDGQRVPVMVHGQALRDADGRIVGSVEVFSQRETNPYAWEKRRGQDDSLDSVTGLGSRRFGELHLQTLMRAVSDGAMTLGVLFLDADHFKQVNDAFGHRTGDAVLRMVGQSLANGLRRGDTPVRWGGEEFVALLPGITESGLAVVAERIRMLVQNSWIQQDETQIRVTVSVGATMARPAESPDDVVDRADRLMYESKQAGRDRVTTGTGAVVNG